MYYIEYKYMYILLIIVYKNTIFLNATLKKCIIYRKIETNNGPPSYIHRQRKTVNEQRLTLHRPLLNSSFGGLGGKYSSHNLRNSPTIFLS